MECEVCGKKKFKTKTITMNSREIRACQECLDDLHHLYKGESYKMKTYELWRRVLWLKK